MQKFLLLISVVSVLAGCYTSKIRKIENTSILAISATSSGAMTKGYGMIITLENVETKVKYESKSLGLISPHSIIQNIEKGEYKVKKVVVPVGNITYSNWSKEVDEFFGLLKIEENLKYYLGNFIGERAIGRKNVLKLKIEDKSIPAKIKSTIENDITGWKAGEFVKFYPYQREELMVY